MSDPPQKPSVMRNLGLTLGDLWSVIKTGRTKPATRNTVRRSTEESTHDTPQGKVTLRRTVIEEIAVEPPAKQAGGDQGRPEDPV